MNIPNKKNKLLLQDAHFVRLAALGLKLHVTHRRKMKDGSLKSMTEIRQGQLQKSMLAMGGETEVVLIDLHNKTQTVGLARCGKKDHYNRLMGITLGFNAALIAEESAPINPDYLSPMERAVVLA